MKEKHATLKIACKFSCVLWMPRFERSFTAAVFVHDRQVTFRTFLWNVKSTKAAEMKRLPFIIKRSNSHRLPNRYAIYFPFLWQSKYKSKNNIILGNFVSFCFLL